MLMHYTEIWCISYGILLVFANGLLCRRFYSICKSIGKHSPQWHVCILFIATRLDPMATTMAKVLC